MENKSSHTQNSVFARKWKSRSHLRECMTFLSGENNKTIVFLRLSILLFFLGMF